MNKYQALKDALDGTSSVNWEHDQGAKIYEVGTGILIASTMETEDGEYVAAAQPSTIRQLLADLEAAEKALNDIEVTTYDAITASIAQMAREAHDAGAKAGGWVLQWEHMAPSQRKEWEAVALAVARLVAEDCAKVCEGRITPERITLLDADGWSVAETNALATGLEGAAQAIRSRYSKE